MGSQTFDGVRFSAFTDDHPPPHVHGNYAGVRVVLTFIDGKIQLARRKDRIIPRNAKRADVNYILQAARKHASELEELWRAARG